MILEALIFVFSASLTIVIGQVLITLFRQHQTNKYWAARSPKLPVPDEFTSVWGGHARSVFYQSKNVDMVDKLHRKYGKSFGFYLNSKPAIATMDLDLIKALVIDEPYANVNRTMIDIPVEELENDCIMFAENDQWRRLRQASAPAFT